MRTPNHLEIKEFIRSTIPAILNKWSLGTVEDIKFDDQGWVNVTAFVNDRYVLRFNARDMQLPKFKRELRIYKNYSNILPLPELLAYDDSKSLVPYEYLITRKIDGHNLDSSWNTLSKNDREILAFQAGQLLRKIHSIEFENFGEISKAPPFPETTSWVSYLTSVFNYHLNEAKSLNLFQDTSYGLFEKFFKQNIHIFESKIPSTLVHGDFHFGNLLFKDNRIVAVLDFEWVCAGDPLLDISNTIMTLENNWPDSQVEFYKGYGGDSISETDRLKIQVYTMIKNIEICIVANKYFPADEAREYIEVTERDVLNKF